MAQDPSLSIIGAAVSPVVMISANAILTSGINARNSNIADRLRNLTGEYRRPETNAERRQSIEKQIPLFRMRAARLEAAILFLFLATACFVTTVMVISIAAYAHVAEAVALPVFLAGVLLMLAGVLAELLELRIARRTLAIEVATTLDAISHRT